MALGHEPCDVASPLKKWLQISRLILRVRTSGGSFCGCFPRIGVTRGISLFYLFLFLALPCSILQSRSFAPTVRLGVRPLSFWVAVLFFFSGSAFFALGHTGVGLFAVHSLSPFCVSGLVRVNMSFFCEWLAALLPFVSSSPKTLKPWKTENPKTLKQ